MGSRFPDVEQTWGAMKMPIKTSMLRFLAEGPINIQGGISALEE